VPGGGRGSSNKSNPATAGNGKASFPFPAARLVSQTLATSQSHYLTYSSVRICIDSQQAEGYEAGHDVCSELTSHDACVSPLVGHLPEGLINALVFVAIRFDTAHHYSVASSH
jgi:hypothetical protein